jgi:N-acetylneuraminic acid mutarotase
MMKKILYHFILLLAVPFHSNAQDTAKTSHSWQIITAQGAPEKREDCGFVEVNGLFYLIGGRGIKPVDVFDPTTNTWQQKSKSPLEIHHFQAVAYKNFIYMVGGMTGVFPHEKPLENIYLYNTQTDEWQKGPAMPAGRLRGSGGCVVYKGKIYLVCGIQDGHYDGNVNWMDEFDPETGKWSVLPDAPHARDHFHAVVIGHKLYATAGRRTSMKTNNIMQLTIPEVDVYDFKNKTWQTLPAGSNILTLRGGGTAVAYKRYIVLMGGESIAQNESHREVEEFDTKTGAWNKLPRLVTGRHDTQAIVYKGNIYIAAGAANRGGGPDQNTIEVLKP